MFNVAAADKRQTPCRQSEVAGQEQEQFVVACEGESASAFLAELGMHVYERMTMLVRWLSLPSVRGAVNHTEHSNTGPSLPLPPHEASARSTLLVLRIWHGAVFPRPGAVGHTHKCCVGAVLLKGHVHCVQLHAHALSPM